MWGDLTMKIPPYVEKAKLHRDERGNLSTPELSGDGV